MSDPTGGGAPAKPESKMPLASAFQFEHAAPSGVVVLGDKPGRLGDHVYHPHVKSGCHLRNQPHLAAQCGHVGRYVAPPKAPAAKP